MDNQQQRHGIPAPALYDIIVGSGALSRPMHTWWGTVSTTGDEDWNAIDEDWTATIELVDPDTDEEDGQVVIDAARMWLTIVDASTGQLPDLDSDLRDKCTVLTTSAWDTVTSDIDAIDADNLTQLYAFGYIKYG